MFILGGSRKKDGKMTTQLRRRSGLGINAHRGKKVGLRLCESGRVEKKRGEEKRLRKKSDL